jgi:hypothetical protein
MQIFHHYIEVYRKSILQALIPATVVELIVSLVDGGWQPNEYAFV